MPFAARRLSDINPRFADSQISELTIFQDKLYFSATDGVSGSELWVYDGQNEPQRITDINVGGASANPNGLIIFQDKLFFSADEGESNLRDRIGAGRSLWSYDGINSPQKVSEVGYGTPVAWGTQPIVFQDKLFFAPYSVDEGTSSTALWSYDGVNPPAPVENFPAEVLVYTNPNFIVFQAQLFFSALGEAVGKELWKFDGQNVSLVADTLLGARGSYPEELTVFKNKLYFRGNPELYAYDGSGEPERVDAIAENDAIGTYPEDLTVLGNRLYFLATDDDGSVNLWSYDGEVSTEFIAEVRRANSNYRPSYLTAFDGKLYFRAEGQTDDSELWVYDGTNPPVLVADINPGAAASDIRELVVFQDQLVFTADDGATGRELWSHGDISDANDTPTEPPAAPVAPPQDLGTIQISNPLITIVDPAPPSDPSEQSEPPGQSEPSADSAGGTVQPPGGTIRIEVTPIRISGTSQASPDYERAFGNLNGDQYSDMLWRNVSDGAIFQMSLDPSPESLLGLSLGGMELPKIEGRDWQMQGLGDIDGDNQPELLWHHAKTGQLVAWQMDEETATSATPLPTVSDRNWAIKGIHDFDSDGASDLLWFNQTEGKAAIWYMDATGIRERASLDISTLEPGYDLAVTGDFDGNGSLDFLWYPGQGTEYEVWLMNGLTIQSQGSAISDPSLDKGGTWTVLGSGDYSGSGVDDLLWQNVDTGETQTWRIIDGISTFQQRLAWPQARS